MQSAFKNGIVAYKNQIIPIAWIDGMSEKYILTQNGIGVDNYPKYVVYNNGWYFGFPEGPDLNLFFYFINKILYPVVILKTEEEIERFWNTELEWVEDTPFYKQGYFNISHIFEWMDKVTRVIAFVD